MTMDMGTSCQKELGKTHAFAGDSSMPYRIVVRRMESLCDEVAGRSINRYNVDDCVPVQKAGARTSEGDRHA